MGCDIYCHGTGRSVLHAMSVDSCTRLLSMRVNCLRSARDAFVYFSRFRNSNNGCRLCGWHGAHVQICCFPDNAALKVQFMLRDASAGDGKVSWKALSNMAKHSGKVSCIALARSGRVVRSLAPVATSLMWFHPSSHDRPCLPPLTQSCSYGLFARTPQNYWRR